MICPSYPIVLRLSFKVYFDTIFPGVPLTFVFLSGRVHRLHGQEDSRTDLTVSTVYRIFFRTGERLLLRMALCFTHIRAFTAGPECFVFYLKTKILTN